MTVSGPARPDGRIETAGETPAPAAGTGGLPGGAPAEILATRQAGLLAEPSAGFVVGLFGAWAAGLGVLPLPVDFPDERLRAMLADCRPRILLTSRSQAGRARRLVDGMEPPIRVLVIEDAGDERPPAPAPSPCAPAFTVYTSGSTGRPKGVLIRQDQIAPLVAWSGRTWGLGPWVRMAQTLSLGFDFGLQELFTTLPFGGCVVVPAPADRVNAREYARFLGRERVTVLFTTPSFADELVAAGEPLPTLRLILLGGEVLKRSTVLGLRALVPAECRLFNGYGPTEAAVNCLMYEVPADTPDEPLPAVLPVGRASAAARVRVVDGHGRPVPAGAVGEIVIGGIGVAAGYLHRPDLTRGRFSPDPEGDVPGAPCYRTGDLAYLRPDGEFVVVGRTDRQVKVRGFRAELEEIERVLREAPGVTAAAVRMVGEPARLVGYLTGPRVDVERVAAEAGRLLPPALVPEQFVPLERLPTTTNGKLDDQALVRLAEAGHASALSASASPAEVESAICRVWAAALGVPDVRPEENVFDRGAHSLIVTRVHGRLEAVLGTAFPIHEIFEYPCPRDLGRRLSAARRHGARTSLSATTVKDRQ